MNENKLPAHNSVVVAGLGKAVKVDGRWLITNPLPQTPEPPVLTGAYDDGHDYEVGRDNDSPPSSADLFYDGH